VEKPLVSNAANPKQVKAAERKVKSNEELHEEDMHKILGTAEGKRVFWKMMEFCKVFEESFTGNSETFYNEGRRSVGLKILGDINSSRPEAYIEMMGINNKQKGEFNG